MGEDLERKRRRNEKRKRDIALEENLKARTLFSGSPETYTTLFRCESGKHSDLLKSGDPLLIRDNQRGRVEILKSGVTVGFMSKADAEGLRDILKKEHRATGICLGEVAKPLMGESFRVKIRPINPGGAAHKSNVDSEAQ